MFCYVDRYFVILFRLLHFLFQRDLVSFHWFLNMTSFHRNRYTQIMYMCIYIYIYIYIYKITDYIICVYAVYMLMYTYTYMYVYMCVCVYIYICAVIPHTALLSHSELPQGKFLHRDSPNSESLFKHSPVWCCVSDLWLWSVWWAAVCWREGRRPSSWAHTPNTSLAEWGRAAHRTTTADWRQRSAPTDPRRSRPDKHQHILINNLTHLYHIHIEICTNQML